MMQENSFSEWHNILWIFGIIRIFVYLLFDIILRPAWGYTCEKDLCKKVVLKDTNLTSLMSLPTCRMLCGTEIGTILPKPRGFSMFSRVNTQHINIDDILFSTGSFDKFHTEWTEARNRFIAMQRKKNVLNFKMESGGKQLKIEVISESDDMGKLKFANLNYI